MSDSLSNSSSFSTENNGADDKTVAEDNLIDKICNNTNIPAIGSSISSIVRQSRSNEGSIKKLADLILADVALTQKILRVSNSASFCTSVGQEVTSVSVAIQLLGMAAIKTYALAITLVDGLPDSQTQCVRIELAHALAASVAGRDLAERSHFKNVEEVAIVALFKNMGRLLVAAYDSKLYWEIMILVKQDTHTLEQASYQIMGFTFDALAENALKKWKIPETIINAMKLLPTRVLMPPKTRLEWMRQAAEFSESLALHILQEDKKKKEDLTQLLIKRFGKTLNFGKAELNGLITHTTKATGSLTSSAQLVLPADIQKRISMSSTDTAVETDLKSRQLIDTYDRADAEHRPSGKPIDAHALLSAGLQKVNELVSGTFKINDLIMLVLETLHNGLGSRFTTLCLKDVKANQYQARHSLGINHSEYQQNFIFSVVQSDDLFHLAMKMNVDLLISDTSSQKVRVLIPHWHFQLLPDTRSLIILPLVIENQPIGLFYMDSKQMAPEGVSSEEMALLKALKIQVLAAFGAK